MIDFQRKITTENYRKNVLPRWLVKRSDIVSKNIIAGLQSTKRVLGTGSKGSNKVVLYHQEKEKKICETERKHMERKTRINGPSPLSSAIKERVNIHDQSYNKGVKMEYLVTERRTTTRVVN